MRHLHLVVCTSTLLLLPLQAAVDTSFPQVKVAAGQLQGETLKAGVAYKGIPFAQPPVGDLRWQAPHPVKPWTGVRKATNFGPRCMQNPIFGDMGFRSDGVSEDCLYLNIWTPAKSATAKLPVLIYFYGGGFMAGDGSEPRYDGEAISRKGIVTVTVNYRLNVFGFLSHPELTQESPNHASGNYGLLDQAAAIRWVHDNITAFGGDPKRITIAGESAGSSSVSAQMASPLSRDLIAGAIGSSGSMMGTLSAVPLKEGEQLGAKWATSIGVGTLAALRAMPAEELLKISGKQGTPRFPATVDGYFLPKSPLEIFTAGEQAHVPLLVGWNSEEQNWRRVIAKGDPTPENYASAIQELYGKDAPEVLKLFPGTTNAEVLDSATALASGRFTGYSSWKWVEMQVKTGGGKPVYRYYYSHPRPDMKASMGNATAGLAGGVVRNSGNAPVAPRNKPSGAVHSADIEYAMGNLGTNLVYEWTADDNKISANFQNYYANFVKTGNPNGSGAPAWPQVTNGQVLRLDVETKASPEWDRERFTLLDRLAPR